MSGDLATETSPEPAGNGLTRRAVTDLDWLTANTGDSKTDVINRAIAVARLFAELGDGRCLRVVAPDGSIERVHLI